jgi:hypothetical protein
MKIKTKSLIQTTFLLLLSCLLCFGIYGQTKETSVKKIYLQLGAGSGNQNGTFSEFGIQAILKNNWVTTFSYHNMEIDPKNLPANYEPGYTVVLIFPIPDGYPDTKMNIYSLTGGKCFKAGRKIWFTTEAGFSIVNGEKMSFTPQPVEESYWLIGYSVTSNYSVKKEKKTTIGGMLKADFNWAFLPYVGLGAGVFANFNSIQSPVGYQLKLTCGWMNSKKKRK